MKRYFSALSALLVCSAAAFAQSFTGSLSGRVQDQQSAPLAKASVVLRSDDTGVERRTSSGAAGDYSFAALTPGRYTLRAEATGLAPASARVDITVATALRADLILQVQGVAESVTVSAGGDAVAVQTEQATIGTSITSRQLAELPSITRNPYDFVALSAGATQSNDQVVIGISASSLRRGLGIVVNGQRSSSGNYILDGGENNDSFFGAVAQSVPLDAVQEFRVQTNNYTAEYGRGSGFIANVVTKSGTNSLHGGAYWYNRNSVFAANTFQNNSTRNRKPVFNRNQFGADAGGAMVKNKLFFFGAVEPILVRSTVPTNFFVPTAQLLASSAPGAQAIFKKFPAPNTFTGSAARTSTICAYDFAGNKPGLCPGGAGRVTIPGLVQVTRTGPQDAGAGVPQDTYLLNLRADYNLSDKTQIFLRYNFQNNDESGVVLQPYSDTLDQPTKSRNQNALLNLTRLWSNSLVTESRVVFNRVNGPNKPLVPTGIFPTFSITSELSTLPGGTDELIGVQNLLQFFQTANWTKGRHNVRFGGQYIHQRDNRTIGNFESGQGRFNTIQDFVDGVMNRITIAVDPKGRTAGQTVPPPFGAPSFTRHFRYNEAGFFFQDTWKLTSRITLTPGIRWEYFGVLHSPDKEKSLDANFYFGPGANIFEKVANGNFFRVADAPDPYKGTFYRPDYNNFAPRLGLAWDVFGDGKTSFRAGAGIFYDRPFGQVLFSVVQNPPNFASAVVNNVPVNQALLDNQYTAFPNAPVSFTNASRFLDPDLRTAYSVAWNFSLEREVGHRYVAGVSYVASSGNKLYAVNNLNRNFSGQFLGRPAQRLFVNAAGLNVRSNQGHSGYEGLQVKVDSRYNDRLGLQFGTSYSLGHSIDNNSSFFADDPAFGWIGFGFLDPFRPQLDRGSSDFDVRHRFSGNFIWDVPLAKSPRNSVTRLIASGWQVAGTLQFQTGLPFSLLDNGASGYVGNEAPRPTITGAPPQTFNDRSHPDAALGNTFLYVPINAVRANGVCIAAAAPIACAAPVSGPFAGTIPRNTFRRPGTQSHNVSFFKNWRVREKSTLQLRAEFYNILNHSNFYMRTASNNVNSNTFTPAGSGTGPGVTAFFADNRQAVIALKYLF